MRTEHRALLLLLASCSGGVEELKDPTVPITVSPRALDFGDALTGSAQTLSVTLTNPTGRAVEFTATMLDDGDGAFSATPDRGELGTGFRAVSVRFAPVREGAHSGRLRIAAPGGIADPVLVELTGRAIDQPLRVDPLTVDFGSVTIGHRTSLPMALENASSSPVEVTATLSSIDLCDDAAGSNAFCLRSAARALDTSGRITLAPGERVDFGVDFAPTVAAAERHASVTWSPCAGCAPLTQQITGTGTDSALVCDPSLALPGVAPGSCTRGTVTCVNTAGPTRTITAWVIAPASEFVVHAPPAPVTLAAGEQAEVEVEYCPRDVGADTDTLVVTNDDPVTALREQRVALSGAGGASPLVVEPTSVDFGEVSRAGPARRFLTLRNASGAPVELTAAAFERSVGFSTDLAALVLTPGARAVFSVTFAPAALGAIDDRLHLSVSGAPELVVDVRGVGVDLPPCTYAVTPAALDLGAIERGRSARAYVEVANVGAVECLITGLYLVPGVTAPEITILERPNASQRLAPGDSALVTVEVASERLGPLGGTLEVTLSSPAAPTAAVTVAARVVASAPLITPRELDFGSPETVCAELSRTLAVHNVGGPAITVAAVQLEPGSSGDFELTPPPAQTLGLGDTARATVRYRPTGGRNAVGGVSIDLEQGGVVTRYRVGLVGRGRSGARHEERFTQPGSGAADILLVIDGDSTGTGQLRGNAAAFVGALASMQLDYRIAIVSSDGALPGAGTILPSTPAAERVVTPSSAPSPEAALSSHVAAVPGVGLEQGLWTSLLAVSSPRLYAENAGILRNDVPLTVVFFGDEDDQSSLAVDAYVGAFQALRRAPLRKLTALSAVAGDVPGGCRSGVGAAMPAPRAIEVAERTGGTFRSLCASDWAAMLPELVREDVGPRNRFVLEDSASPSSIEVRVDGQLLPSDTPAGVRVWHYDASARAVIFELLRVPAPGSEIAVSYRPECA